MDNIIKQLEKNCNLKIIWVIFPPNKINEVKEKSYEIIDYHNYDNALEILNITHPDLIMMEGSFGMVGITFSESARFKKIPVATIFPPGILPLTKSFSEVKRKINLIFSHNVLGSTDQNSSNHKFGMLRYFLKRYFFLLKTLKCINYDLFDIFKFILFYPSSHIFLRQVGSVHRICSGDLNFVRNESQKQYLIDMGYTPKTIVVSGDPTFDQMLLNIQKSQSLNKIYNEPIKKNSKIKILFCTSPMHEHGAWTKKQEDTLISSTINEISKSTNFQISIKIHPTSSKKEEYIDLLNKFMYDISLYQKEDLIELINNHDLMIAYGSSTVVLYGILLKKPIVMLNLDDYPSKYNYFIDDTVMSICENISKLIPTLNLSLSQEISDNVYRKYLQNQLGMPDGKSSERIANKILELFDKT